MTYSLLFIPFITIPTIRSEKSSHFPQLQMSNTPSCVPTTTFRFSYAMKSRILLYFDNTHRQQLIIHAVCLTQIFTVFHVDDIQCSIRTSLFSSIQSTYLVYSSVSRSLQ